MSLTYIDINAISLRQQDECFCLKLGQEVELCKFQSINITFSDLDDLSLASICQSRAE